MVEPKSRVKNQVYMGGESGSTEFDQTILENLDDFELSGKKGNVLYSDDHPVLLMQ